MNLKGNIELITPKENRLSPLLKYPGGKERELKYILPNLPADAVNYYEPFVGGGSVYLSVDSEHYFINDKSSELIRLYRLVAEQNEAFLGRLVQIDHNWMNLSRIVENHKAELLRIYRRYRRKPGDEQRLSEVINRFVTEHAEEFNGLLNDNFNVAIEHFTQELVKSVCNKIIRMEKLEKKQKELPTEDVAANLEGAFKSGFYMHFRYLYNHIEELQIDETFATAIYYFMREYCYSSMFRYNKEGKFNVPYGGISYNRKSMSKKAEYFRDEALVGQLRNTIIANLDFETFFEHYAPGQRDFIFLDPPYDTEFSSYAGNEFGQNDQIRLADYLIRQCRAYFMLIIKNTDFILGLYPDGLATANGKRLYVNRFDKRYTVSFQDRNDKNAEHLLITNYPIT
ncbi:MAG: DNA adenine methylase [Lachnospiraceae bacterium]